MTDPAITAALAWLEGRDSPESAIAAHEFGRATSDEDARRWVRWLLDGERDGSWDGDLLETARALLTIRELREAAGLRELDPAIGRALDWLRDRQGRPGAWTDGCDPDRHRIGLCHHFSAGYFSPGPRAVLLEGVRHPSGAPLAGDPESRFVLSALALRCVLQWRGPSTDGRIHLDVLRWVVRQWPDSAPAGLTTTALLAAVHGLLASDRPGDREAAGTALDRIAGRQRGDGSWPDTDVFQAMAVFRAGAEVSPESRRIRTALEHGSRLLRATQRDDGSWGPDYGPRRALIAVRTLRAVGAP